MVKWSLWCWKWIKAHIYAWVFMKAYFFWHHLFEFDVNRWKFIVHKMFAYNTRLYLTLIAGGGVAHTWNSFVSISKAMFLLIQWTIIHNIWIKVVFIAVEITNFLFRKMAICFLQNFFLGKAYPCSIL